MRVLNSEVAISGIFNKNTPLIVNLTQTRGGILINFILRYSKYAIFFGACGGLTRKDIIFRRFRISPTFWNLKISLLIILQWYKRVMFPVKRETDFFRLFETILKR